MKTVYQERSEALEAELQDAKEHIARLTELLEKISGFLNNNADYDIPHPGSGYVPCNDEARLLNEIETTI